MNEIERRALYRRVASLEKNLAEIRKALEDETHVVILRSKHWFIRHPLKCREDIESCRVNHALIGVDRKASWMPQANGSYLVDLAEDAVVIGNRVPNGYDPLLAKLESLGVWGV